MSTSMSCSLVPNPEPVTVTRVPPSVLPECGLTEWMSGVKCVCVRVREGERKRRSD